MSIGVGMQIEEGGNTFVGWEWVEEGKVIETRQDETRRETRRKEI
jgi:hypothetical protein